MSKLMDQLPAQWAPFKHKIAQTEQPVMQLTLQSAENLALWQSKVGGHPYWPVNAAFPCERNGKPLTLLAQINFADMPALSDFPSQGILQFFIGTDDVYGLDFNNPQQQDGFRVIYHEEVEPDASRLKHDFSDIAAQWSNDVYLPFSGQYAIQFTPTTQFISTNDCLFAKQIFGVDNLRAYKETYTGKDFWQEMIQPYNEMFAATGHRLGGYPFFTQEDPRDQETQWQAYRLLLQIDTDDAENDIMWGDCGVSNFFIHPDDLKNKDFSKVIYNWDCH